MSSQAVSTKERSKAYRQRQKEKKVQPSKEEKSVRQREKANARQQRYKQRRQSLRQSPVLEDSINDIAEDSILQHDDAEAESPSFLQAQDDEVDMRDLEDILRRVDIEEEELEDNHGQQISESEDEDVMPLQEPSLEIGDTTAEDRVPIIHSGEGDIHLEEEQNEKLSSRRLQ